MNIQENQLEKLPYSVKKKQLMAMFLGQMTEKQIREGINTIIADNRKECTPKNSVAVQLIWHDELMEFIAVYGMPKGYYNPYKEKTR